MSAQPSITPLGSIPGIPERVQQRLQQVFDTQDHLEAVWLFGSRAMGRHREGSDIDLCLEGRELSHRDRLRLMVAIDELLLPWQVDVALRGEISQDLEAHLQRVGCCIWRRS
ncbi:nucleotidyltransferase domain-containing protein [Cyanobium sp. N5-Cardenillas]|uniref:nucleotidyltransferase domain-containing protein n=1 Tax=Cyanobium sp. N5-Cardenillas TaxID=2823720 RepID=UPI0020CE41FD|nr:nucleotidyltransferase domain-containing protein [Cyanobium sp. N5-Cardenillas]MCP9785458.1 nucleotidyltransferase domain-containing protein [Cyanobium sp. N5-Cardenillas]